MLCRKEKNEAAVFSRQGSLQGGGGWGGGDFCHFGPRPDYVG